MHGTIWQIVFDKTPLLLIVFAVLCWFILALAKRVPEATSIKLSLSVLNDKGGQILLLTCLSCWFFSVSMHLFYYAIQQIAQKTLAPDNAVLLMGLQFCTGVAFGGSFGALLKTMDGHSQGEMKRASDTSGPSTPTTPTALMSAATAEKEKAA